MKAIARCLLTNGQNPSFKWFIFGLNWTHFAWDDLLCTSLQGCVVYSSDDGNIGCVLARIDNSATLSHKLCCAFAHSKTSQVGCRIISLYFKNATLVET